MYYYKIYLNNISVIVFILIFFAITFSIQGDWQPAGKMAIPQHNYAFLATSRTGDLMAATFNSVGLSEPPKNIPALLIKNPTSETPEVKELCSVKFPPQRGYSGVACDETGCFYLSGDTGDPSTCFVKKFNSDGTPNMSFGKNGEIKPNMRCLGVDVVGEFLLLAVDWGKILILKTTTGELIGNVPQANPSVFLRDIAIDPASLKIYGVAAGSVVVWQDGSPFSASNYKFKILTEKSGEIRSSEGIAFDPVTRAALVCPIPGNVVNQVTSDGKITKTAVISEDPRAHYGDIALSFNGETIFISDMINQTIYIMKRGLTEQSAEIKPISKPPIQIAAPAEMKPITWNKSYTDVVETARKEQKPMVVYFRKAGFKKCEEFENNILLKEDFKKHAQRFICVFEDVDRNSLLAYRFGVFRTPYIAILDGKGETNARFLYNIKPDLLYSALDSTK